MTSLGMPICMGCAHFNRTHTGWGLRCAAYPDGIPDPIIESRVDHRQAYSGDGGVRFEPVDTEAETYAEDLFNPMPEDPYREDDALVETEVA